MPTGLKGQPLCPFCIRRHLYWNPWKESNPHFHSKYSIVDRSHGRYRGIFFGGGNGNQTHHKILARDFRPLGTCAPTFLAEAKGVEPSSSKSTVWCAIQLHHASAYLVRLGGIEPPFRTYKIPALPLNYRRILFNLLLLLT